MNPSYFHINSPLGKLELEEQNQKLTAVRFNNFRAKSENQISQNSILHKAETQLLEYFAGERIEFDLPIKLKGTAFEEEVWQQLNTIHYGDTITYGELAEKLGDVKKVRAVGRANGQNSIPIIIPCHRVIGADNKLTGYSGGIENKKWLLKHEGSLLL